MDHGSDSDAFFEYWKTKGDGVYFQTLLGDHLPSVVYVQRMTQALSHYLKAFGYVSNMEQEATITKLMGKLQYNCGERLYKNHLINVRTLPQSDHEDDRLLIDYYLKEAMIEFERAWKCWHAKSSNWRHILEEDQRSCACLLLQLHYHHYQESEQSFPAQIGRLEVLCQRTKGYYRGIFYLWLAKLVFQKAQELQVTGDFRNAAQLLCGNQLRIEEARKVLQPSDIEELQLNSDKLLNVIQSVEAKQKGDALWIVKETPLSEELSKRIVSKNTDEQTFYILEAADWYKTAINFARLGQSLENEAKVHVQLGRLYEGNVQDKSRKHYEMAANIAAQIGTDGNDEWYRLCSEGLTRFYWMEQWKENKDRDGLRTIIRHQLVHQLTELEHAARQPIEDMLEIIYRKYPPKSPGAEKPEGSNLKVKLKRALLHYHPDKQNVDGFGLHWMVLAEEITILLNRQFARLFKA